MDEGRLLSELVEQNSKFKLRKKKKEKKQELSTLDGSCSYLWLVLLVQLVASTTHTCIRNY